MKSKLYSKRMLGPPSLETLKELFQTARGQGNVILELRPRQHFPASTPKALDSFVSHFGLKSIDISWVEIPEKVARWIISEYLHKDLAYGLKQVSKNYAEQLASQFLEHFARPAQFFTNGGLYTECPGATPEKGSYFLRLGEQPFNPESKGVFEGSWTPLTEATFDTGIVAVNDDYIAIVWYSDED
jgi:hypothetical protein